MTVCGNYQEETFVIPVETYNSWVQEDDGTIQIILVQPPSKSFYCSPNLAYVQFQVDEDCGTFSLAPSESAPPSEMPSISTAPSSSVAPSSEPSQDCPLPRQSTGSGSCDANCGGNAGDCWCDEFCLEFEDCCTDAYLCEEVGCSAPALRSSAGIYGSKDSSATNHYDVILEPKPDKRATIPSGAITISWYKPDGNALEWSYPSDTRLLYFSEYLAKNVPDGEYKVELKPKSGGRSRSGRVVLVRENGTKPIGGLEDISTEVEGGDIGDDNDGGDER